MTLKLNSTSLLNVVEWIEDITIIKLKRTIFLFILFCPIVFTSNTCRRCSNRFISVLTRFSRKGFFCGYMQTFHVHAAVGINTLKRNLKKYFFGSYFISEYHYALRKSCDRYLDIHYSPRMLKRKWNIFCTHNESLT